MDLLATKDTHEREDEEAERLMRPAPKLKPPRHDRRREDIQPDSDPDLQTDPDTSRDKDLSKNYKTIGGSMAHRIVARKLLADIDRSNLISVHPKDDPKKVVHVTKKTLADKPGEYELIEDTEEEPSEAPSPTEPSSEPESSATPPSEPGAVDYGEAKRILFEHARKNPTLKNTLRLIADPDDDSTFGDYLRRNPEGKASDVLGKFKDKLPPGIETISDLQKALKAKVKKQKAPDQGAPGEPPTDKKDPQAESPAESAEAEPAPAKDPSEPASEPPAGDQQLSKAVTDSISEAVRKALPDAGSKAPAEGEKKEKGKGKGKGKKKEKGKDKDKDKEGEPDEAPLSEADQASKDERDQADRAINSSFPPSIAKFLLGKNLPPKDVGALISDYKTARDHDVDPDNVSEFATKISQNYHLDPDKVPPPEVVLLDGYPQPFKSLPPEEQKQQMDRHRMRTVAMSLAAREQVQKSLRRAGAPEHLAEKLTGLMLAGGTPEEKMQRAKTEAQNTFSKGLASGHIDKDITDDEIDDVVAQLSNDPAAQQVAVAYFQAHDYKLAREEFLNPRSPNHISERQSPEMITRGLTKASGFLEERGQRYPKNVSDIDTGYQFRKRVLDKIKTLSPEKAPIVEEGLQEYEAGEYEKKSKNFEKDRQKFHKLVLKIQAQVERDIKKEERQKGFNLPSSGLSVKDRILQKLNEQGARPPKAPSKPPWYDWWSGRSESGKGSKGKGFWEDFFGGLSKNKGSTSRAANRILSRWASGRFSSYPDGLAMDDSSNRTISARHERQAVYWGVEPYPAGKEGFEPYVKWQQAHARDLGEGDFNQVLTAARSWLRQPVLAKDIEGIVRDTQLRAALDLAIRDHDQGRYSVGFHPALYNQLLARLAGEPKNETLTTITAATTPATVTNTNESTYGVSVGEVSMKASTQITAFAARIANTHPELAYDLIDLASKVAGELPPALKEHMFKKKEDGGGDKDEDQGQQKQAAVYQNLRALIIRTAAKHPEARQAFLPILTELKKG